MQGGFQENTHFLELNQLEKEAVSSVSVWEGLGGLLPLINMEIPSSAEIPSQIFIRRTDAETEAPILGPPDGKSQLIGKDPDGKD